MPLLLNNACVERILGEKSALKRVLFAFQGNSYPTMHKQQQNVFRIPFIL